MKPASNIIIAILLFYIVVVMAICFSKTAEAKARETRPVPKYGQCPIGYYTSGGYCKPGKNAKEIIPKVRYCPAGWYSNGNYCVKGKNTK